MPAAKSGLVFHPGTPAALLQSRHKGLLFRRDDVTNPPRGIDDVFFNGFSGILSQPPRLGFIGEVLSTRHRQPGGRLARILFELLGEAFHRDSWILLEFESHIPCSSSRREIV